MTVNCAHNTPESNDVLAARLLAGLDGLNGADNSGAISHKNIDVELHYGAQRSAVEIEKPVYGPSEIDGKLQSPYKNYFNTKNEAFNRYTNNAIHLILGNHPDLNVRPNEVLGDNIVRPVEDAHREFQRRLVEEKAKGAFDAHLSEIESGSIEDPKLRDKIAEIKEESGYTDALEEAREKIEDRYGDNDDEIHRFLYGREWVKSLQDPRNPSFPEKTMSDAAQNISENHLRNNLVSAGLNYFDRRRAAYQFGFGNYLEGDRLYGEAVKTKSPELTEAGIHEDRFYGKDNGPDVFQLAEPGNKGITYFAAKAHALKSGMSEAEAKLYARKSVEQLQFSNSPVNRPKAQWNVSGRTNLTLWSFGMRERRWYMNLWRGLGHANPAIRRQSARALIYYAAGNAILFGPNADIPEEIGQLWKAVAPKSYQQWREGAGTVSLARALDLSLDEQSRLPLTNIGLVTKLPVVYDQLKRLGEDVTRAYNHPTPRSILKALSSTSMFLPAGLGVPVLKLFGNKMTFAAVDYLYRTFMGDYERHTPGNHKYTTNNAEELGNAVRGGRQSANRQLSNEKRDLRAY